MYYSGVDVTPPLYTILLFSSIPASYLTKFPYSHISPTHDLKLEEAQKNILCTHTTAVSARTLQDRTTGEVHPCQIFFY